jgi:predicted secreted protein
MTTGQILGTSILLQVDTNPSGSANYVNVGLQKSATLSMNTTTEDVSNKDSLLWKEYLPGYKDWSIDCDALLTETDTGMTQLENQWIAGSKVRAIIKTPANAAHWSGTTIIKSLKYTAGDGTVYTSAVSLTGSGALTKT